MASTQKIFVGLNIEGRDINVGELVVSGRKIYFRYNSDFLHTGLNLSPIKLNFNNQIQAANGEPFDGLFGVFADSMPDAWGQLLLNRTLASRGIDSGSITPLDRLAYVGNAGMGALTYKPEIELQQNNNLEIELDAIATDVQNTLLGISTYVIEELYTLGGSSGGARPKILIGYNPETNLLTSNTNKLPEGFQNWIIKFPASADNPEIAKIEYAYHKLAIEAGIEMNSCKLFQGKSGKVYFGTKRFDRIFDKRLHMHTASGIIHDNYRTSTMDYGHLMDCAFRIEKHVKAYEKVFRLAVFNVYAHNCDDHSKNSSFLMNANGEWKFAPAYDLTFSYSSYGFHSTMIAGESKNPEKKHLMKLADHFGLKNGETIIEEVTDTISQWESIAKNCGVGNENIRLIRKQLNTIHT